MVSYKWNTPSPSTSYSSVVNPIWSISTSGSRTSLSTYLGVNTDTLELIISPLKSYLCPFGTYSLCI